MAALNLNLMTHLKSLICNRLSITVIDDVKMLSPILSYQKFWV